MTFLDGAYACSGCGAPVTAWRDNRRVGPVFDADPYQPYQRHTCRQSDPALTRIAAALEALVGGGIGDGRVPAVQTPMRPAAVANGAQPRAVPRSDTPSPRPGQPATDGWGIEH